MSRTTKNAAKAAKSVKKSTAARAVCAKGSGSGKKGAGVAHQKRDPRELFRVVNIEAARALAEVEERQRNEASKPVRITNVGVAWACAIAEDRRWAATKSKDRIADVDRAQELANEESAERRNFEASCELSRITDPDLAQDVGTHEYQLRAELGDAWFVRQQFEELCDRDRIQDVDAAHDDALEYGGSAGSAVVPFVHEGEAVTAEEEEKAEVVEYSVSGVAIPLNLLQASLLIAAKNDIRYHLCSVYIHGVDGEFRIVATDGHRMIVSRFKPAGKAALPKWAEPGIMIPRNEFAQALPFLARNGVTKVQSIRSTYDKRNGSYAPAVLIDVSEDGKKAQLRSANGFASFTVDLVDAKFPDYAKVMASNAATLARGDSDVPLEAAALSTEYIRAVGDIGQRLGAKAVHSFTSSKDHASFFTFDGAPDTVLIIMPMKAGDAVPDGVVRILGRDGVSLSIIALKAHVTRTANLLESTEGKKEREDLEARKADFEKRIAKLYQLTRNGPKQLAAPEAVAA